MPFNSFVFVFAYLPLVLAGFFALRRQGHRLFFVVVASYAFYAYTELWFPLLMATSTAISFVGGLLIERNSSQRTRRLLLAVGVAGVLSLLGFFKYADFLATSASSLPETITAPGLPGLEELTRGILLPAGISFSTFEAIS